MEKSESTCFWSRKLGWTPETTGEQHQAVWGLGLDLDCNCIFGLLTFFLLFVMRIPLGERNSRLKVDHGDLSEAGKDRVFIWRWQSQMEQGRPAPGAVIWTSRC